MAKVIIRDNGLYNADKIEVVFEDGDSREYDWHNLNPNDLRWVLKKLGHKVEQVDFKFEHDED